MHLHNNPLSSGLVVRIINAIAAVFLCLSPALAQQPFTQTGWATYYGRKFHGKVTASGERFNMHDLTAAHRSLPFNTYVRITNLANKKTVVVRINDRGPVKSSRIIDLSRAAAEKLDMIEAGTVKVRIVEVDRDAYRRFQRTSKGSYYRLKTNRSQPSGYGVQIAAVTDLGLSLPYIADLSEEEHEHVLVKVSKSKRKTWYRLIIGGFATKARAHAFLRKWKAKGRDGFVLAL